MSLTSPKRILIVDDEPRLTRMIRLILEKTGRYVVRSENRALRAAAAVREFRPHLILLDVIMPDLTGGEVAAHLRSDPALCHIPIVFLTATVTPREAGPNGATRGGLVFLAKPATLEELVDCIERHTAPPPPAPPAERVQIPM